MRFPFLHAILFLTIPYIMNAEGGSIMDFNQQTLNKIRGLIVFTVLVLIGVYRFDIIISSFLFILKVLLPLIIGCAIAFILSVPMKSFRKHLFSRFEENPKTKSHKVFARLSAPLSLILALCLVVAIIMVVIGVVLPELTATLSQLAKTLPEQAPAVIRWIQGLFADYPEIVAYINDVNIDWQEVLSSIVNFFSTGATAILGSGINVAMGVVSFFTTFFIAFVFAIYILLQKQTLSRQMRKLLFAYCPKQFAEDTIRIAKMTHRIFSSFLTGQCFEAVILGFMFFVAMTLLKLPYALLVGVLIAFTALIPVFGAFMGCLIGAFLIVTVSPAQALIFVILFVVLQQLEGNLIYPHVVGGSVGLPSLWVLAAVTVGGSLFGIVGMLVFIPIVSVFYALLKENVTKRLEARKIIINNE